MSIPTRSPSQPNQPRPGVPSLCALALPLCLALGFIGAEGLAETMSEVLGRTTGGGLGPTTGGALGQTTGGALARVAGEAGAAASAGRLRPVSVQLQWRHQWQFAGFYAALAQGYYRDAGLDVSLIEGGPEIDPVASVLADRADFGTASADVLLRSRAEGEQLKLLATYARRSPLVLLVQPGVYLPRDLRGKRVMLPESALDGLNVRAMLRRARLAQGDIELAPYQPAVDAFVRGDVDAMTAYRANETFALLRLGVPFGILDPADYGTPMPDQNLFTSAALAEADPDTAAALAAATTHGWSYALEHVDELVALIRARWNSQRKSPEHLRFEAHQTRSAMLPELHPIGLPRPERLAAVAALMRDLDPGMETADLDALLSHAAAPTLSLSDAERAFRDANPRLSVGYAAVAPFVEATPTGPSGYAVELMERIARRAGFTLRWREAGLDQVYGQLRAGDVDLTINSVRTPNRARFLSFSERAYPIQPVIVARRGRWEFNSLPALAGHRLAHVAGDPFPELLAGCSQDLSLVAESGFGEALRAVARGRVDAALLPRQVAAHLLEANRLTELVIVAEVDIPAARPLEAHPFAVRKDMPLLASILDKAYASLPRSDVTRLWSRWFGDDQSLTYLRPGPLLELTAEQERWLRGRRALRILYPELPPYSMTRRDGATGYSVELLRQLLRLLGLEGEFVSTDSNEVLDVLRAGDADLVLNVAQTPDEEAWLSFGASRARLRSRIFSRMDAEPARGLDDLAGRRVALWPGAMAEPLLAGLEPVPIRVPAADSEDALRAVAGGEADAVIMEQMLGRYLIAQRGIAGIALGPAGRDAGLPERWASLFALHSDERTLGEVLDAAAVALPQATMERVHAQFLGSASLALSVPRVVLSARERAFFDAHPVITLGADPDWAPMSYLDPDGRPAGLDVDTIEAINGLLGSGIRIEFGEWSDLVERAMAHEIDGLTASLPHPQRARRLAFTAPYSEQVHAVYVPAGNPLRISGPDDLAGRRVGYAAGAMVMEELLAAIPGVLPVALSNWPDAMNALLAGEMDAVVGADLTMDFLFAGASESVVEVAYTLGEPIGTVFSIRRDWPELVSAMDKALAALPSASLEDMRQRHLLPSPMAGEMRLSLVEREYLKGKGNRLRYCFSPHWSPYDDQQAGEHRGLFRDFVDLLAAKLGIEVEPVPSETWEQAREMARERHCDFVTGAVRTPSREGYLDFTEPYYTLTHVLIAAEGSGYVGGVDAFAGRRVAVPGASAIAARLRASHEEVEFVEFSDPEQLVNAVRSGEVAAAVATLEHAAELVDDAGGQLRIVGQLKTRFAVAVATRNDEPLLRMVMDKALAAVTPAERDAIELRQTKFTIEERIDLTRLWQLLGVGLLVTAFLLHRQRELQRLNRDLTRARDAARVADAAKTRFLANISHEIRTPMNAIMGMARLCLDTGLGVEQRAWLERQQQASRSLLGLIDDLLDVASLEAGGVSLKRAPFSLDDVLDRVQGVVDLSARERGLLLWFNLDPQLPDTLIGDAQRLEQVLLNLSVNAVKFTRRGEVCIRVERLDGASQVAVERSLGLRFSVSDTGIGVDPDELPRLLEPFGQGDSSSTRACEGSGLGLSICRDLLRLMGTSLQVDSALGRGSRFFFELHLPRLAGDAAADRRLTLAGDAAEALVLDEHDGRGSALVRQLEAFGLATTRVAGFTGVLTELDRITEQLPDAAAGAGPRAVLVALEASPEALEALRDACERSDVRLVAFAGEDEAGGSPLPVSRPRLQSALRQALEGPVDEVALAPSPTVADHRLAGRRVLLAEDNEANRTYVSELLRREGCGVVCAADGLTAVRLAIEESVEVILMDLQMPQLDGLAAARRIRTALADEAPPIIALTAHAHRDAAGLSLEAGMCDHLVKPVTPDALRAALVRALALAGGSFPLVESPSTDADVDVTDPAALVSELMTGLARAAGDEALFQRVAQSFCDEHTDDPARLHAAAQAPDPDTAQRVAHALKGVAMLVGASDLQRLADQVLLELRCGGDWPRAAARLAEQLDHVLTALRVRLTAAEQEVPERP